MFSHDQAHISFLLLTHRSSQLSTCTSFWHHVLKQRTLAQPYPQERNNSFYPSNYPDNSFLVMGEAWRLPIPSLLRPMMPWPSIGILSYCEFMSENPCHVWETPFPRSPFHFPALIFIWSSRPRCFLSLAVAGVSKDAPFRAEHRDSHSQHWISSLLTGDMANKPLSH